MPRYSREAKLEMILQIKETIAIGPPPFLSVGGRQKCPPVSESRPPFLQDPFRIRIAWCQYTKVRQVLQVIALRLNKKPSI